MSRVVQTQPRYISEFAFCCAGYCVQTATSARLAIHLS